MSPSTTPVIPEFQTAVVANEYGDLVVSHGIQVPVPGPGMLLVKTVAVALNPADVKMTGEMATEGATAGSDSSGVVVAIGADVPADKFSIGDRVCAPHASMDPLAPRHGSFAEYVLTAADFTLKIPDGMPHESAASFGTGVGTIGHALFYSLSIPGHPEMPTSNPEVVLVYGGSTASGTMAIQLIRKSGCIPITTCSPKNFGLVKSYGAKEAFDYHDPGCVDAIKAYTKNELDYALDCHCDASSMEFCYRAIGRAGGHYTTLQPYPEQLHTRKRVKPDWILGSALFGKKINWKPPYDIAADAVLHAFGIEWFGCAQRLLDAGELKAHPVRVGTSTGFHAVVDGLKILKDGEVSGEKLVYRVA
ncbi:unnamed protein product [Clonostachys solani]|uniref:Enoyl reductase (ER) domain-containing protein n=1 Tax=Clonostachys solani TaxID=160281 RepID=A0A9P0EPD9_9HYPO|nr:unnamed protein product [Clonostachys solani]